MFAKKALLLAFLSLSLSASAAPAADCTLTQTVTAKSAATSAVLANTGGNGKNTGSNAGSNSGSNTGASTSASSNTAGSAAAASTSSSSSSGSNSGDLQSSLSLESSLIQTGFAQTGQGADAEAGQVASVTSENNFINYCATTNLPLTNGTQIKTGSCNAAPMGIIAATTAMPSSKFVSPKNLDTIPANTNFTVQMAIQNLNTGFFVNPNTNYFAAPQALGSNNMVNGHSHVVIEAIDSLTSTSPSDPTKFNFFKGFNDAAENGILSAAVAGGLPAGTYKMSSINSAANHQPVLVAVAQHGSLDDAVYFTVSDNGDASSSSSSASAAATSAAASTSTAAAGTSNDAGTTGSKGKQTGAKSAAQSGKGKRWLWA